MRMSVQIRLSSRNTSFFPYFTQKCPKMVSKPGRVEIEYREVSREEAIHFTLFLLQVSSLKHTRNPVLIDFLAGHL